MMKWIALLVCAGCCLCRLPQAHRHRHHHHHHRTPAKAAPLPPDFLGLSFEPRGLPPDAQGDYFFSRTNKPLITLFKNIGISHLRMGGTSVESPPTNPIPDTVAIDNLFAFVKAAGVEKVIYSLRLLETNAALHYDATNARPCKIHLGKIPPRTSTVSPSATNLTCNVFLNRTSKSGISPATSPNGAGSPPPSTMQCRRRNSPGPDAGSANVTWTTSLRRQIQEIPASSQSSPSIFMSAARAATFPPRRGLTTCFQQMGDVQPNALRKSGRAGSGAWLCRFGLRRSERSL